MAKISEADLKKQIKSKQFSPAYVIYGSEQMYVKRYTQLLVEAVAGKNPSEFNFHTFKGEINLDDFASSLRIIPFMSEYNCVLLSDIHFDTMKSDELSRFKKITEKSYEGTVLIISMPTYILSKNKEAFNSLVRRVDKFGSTIKFEPINPTMLEKYLVKWAGENGKTLSRLNAMRLINCCGSDLNLLKNEINKISAYAKEEEISAKDIDKLAAVSVEEKVFNLSDAVINGSGDKAFEILNRLFYLQEEPIAILYIISMNYIDAYRVRVADECAVMQNDLAKDFDYGKRTFALNKAKRATRKISTGALRKSLDILIQADEKFKSGSVNPRLYLEQLISKLLLAAKEDSADA